MSFFFKACFQPQTVEQDSIFQKQYYPRVSLLPSPPTQTQQPHKTVSLLPNKFRSRGGFEREGYAKDYEVEAIREQQYRQFLEKKRNSQALWGGSFGQ